MAMERFSMENHCCGGYNLAAVDGDLAVTSVSGLCGGPEPEPGPWYLPLADGEPWPGDFWRPIPWERVGGEWCEVPCVSARGEEVLAHFAQIIEI
jgi:hypothetical protein